MKGKIEPQTGRVTLELEPREWNYLKSIVVFARKAANGPLFAADAESPQIESLARALLDETGFTPPV